jgi:ATP-binding cassette subfamily F protein uup
LEFKRAEETDISEPSKSEPKPAKPAAKSKSKSNGDKPRKLSYNEKREFERLETEIPQMEAEKAQIEQMLYGNPSEGFSQLQELSERLAELTHQIDTATERWMELAELTS